MSNAEGDFPLTHIHNKTEISEVFRWGVVQQAEADRDTSIQLGR